MPADSPGEIQLWERWRATRSQSDRADLWNLHCGYARTMAALLYGRRFSDDVEFGDYLQYAHVGLLEAMERFDPARGAQFRTFAARRIQGAILNGLERQTEKLQQVSARQRIRADRARGLHEAALESSGWSGQAGERQPESLMRYVADVGFGLALAWLLEGTGMVDGGEAAQVIPFYRTTELSQARERLLRALDALPAQERHVLRCHYLQDIRFDEIARELGLTKGRISQIHKKGLAHLRGALSDGGLDLAC
jgi:RNA polymerase sigma factor for flagellar operon FliA